MGVRYRTLNLRRRHNSDRNVGIDPNLFQVTFNNKMNERNRTKEIYDNLTIVFRLIGVITALLRSSDGQPEGFFPDFFSTMI